jgi:hypothetical protein
VLHTQTASEYWQRRGSLVHTDPQGNDLQDHEQARVYFFASSQHHADPNSGPLRGAHRGLSNPLNSTPLLRALLDALDAWVTHGTPPPAGRVPSSANGMLVPAAVVREHFPNIPDIDCPGQPNRLFVQEFGADFDRGLLSKEPPEEDKSKEYAVLVPQVDADGNPIDGLRNTNVQVPLGTYAGWNIRKAGFSEGDSCDLTGAFYPVLQD